ncbi:uncharacterized protein Z518_07387 [Rhinocladiella mackenziei CBS 650.93]|uniref:RING-type domain-containing protein n=1 Tax=Rhinocladiella mackenziei CBS 650.93 TaxID=1442369 RepID=A0A0D2IDC6_9EURO|nr:uncharacterized protein Z518_07387 [Rhinocladiella mackenziei CBS 650.93]KIX03834.1 hypothetical protein Z518_07387 [Rhinocladiella mackenziei CBS 650.93]
MSHSKHNTSLAFFTSHERSLLRSSWGSQSARLTRDSFLPVGYCRLCLSYARNPVACAGAGENTIVNTDGTSRGKGEGKGRVKVHLFCRECALNDLVAQRKEIKRLEREEEVREQEERDSKAREQEEQRRRDVEMFERAEAGFEDDMESGIRGVKRKRQAEEMHASTASSLSRRDEHGEKKAKPSSNSALSSEASFWIPGSEALSTSVSKITSTSKKQKLHPLCPASTPETKHAYSLKTLINVSFAESNETNTSTDEPTRICPSCKKALTNTSRPMLGTAEGCGHVLCGGCVDVIRKTEQGIRCFVCEADLSGGNTPEESIRAREEGDRETGSGKTKCHEKDRQKKDKEKKAGRLVELSCGGTGFARGGANVAKRDGVAFQC